jgi:rhodanese-related sulfurtransferase
MNPSPAVTVEQVPAASWREWAQANAATILDVREPYEWTRGTLPGSQLMPLGSLPTGHARLDRKNAILVVCRSGNRSDSAARFLAGAGFTKVANLAGGLVPLGLA